MRILRAFVVVAVGVSTTGLSGQSHADQYGSMVSQLSARNAQQVAYRPGSTTGRRLDPAPRPVSGELKRAPSRFEVPPIDTRLVGRDGQVASQHGQQATLHRPVAVIPRTQVDRPAAGNPVANRPNASAVAHHYPWDSRTGFQGSCDGATCDDFCAAPACDHFAPSQLSLPPARLPKVRLPKLPKLRKPHCGICDGCCGPILEANACCQKPCCDKQPEPKVCMARRPVNMPKVGFYEAFQASTCHTGLWDGYSRACGKEHKHLHGQCDCGQKKGCFNGHCGGQCGEILPVPACGCATATCDGNSCDGNCGH